MRVSALSASLGRPACLRIIKCNEARRLFGDQKRRVDRLTAAGEDAREAEQPLGLLEVYLSILERHSEYLSRGKKQRQATW